MVGTTDVLTKIVDDPAPSEEEITWILGEVSKYMADDVEVRREDVLSAWAGIRPLVKDPNKANTESLARNHIVHTSPSKLLTVSGGKWTTYRSMATDTVDEAVKVFGVSDVCLLKIFLLKKNGNKNSSFFFTAES